MPGGRQGGRMTTVWTAPPRQYPCYTPSQVLRGVSGGRRGRGGAMLRGGSPASGVVQAGNEEGGQNVNYCPPPSTPFTACAHLLYARAPAACCRCGCLF